MLLATGTSPAQHHPADSMGHAMIQEVIIIGHGDPGSRQAKPLSSIDEYLQQSAQVQMLKRGAYAWEPLINNMSTERTVLTIDGMRIFGACTDKMDPITSYVEVSNLAAAEISSGQSGSCHGSTIGGAIDLKRKTGNFGEKRWKYGLHSGYESVNQQKIFGASVHYRNPKLYTSIDFMNRDAENYKSGGGQEVDFSQFSKLNVSGTAGLLVKEHYTLETSVIYDKAHDVGYPALPMDVSLAEATIASLKYLYQPEQASLKEWETKLYYNTITHRMDDTKRPDVPIHMDMPGWSKTYGYYSKASAIRHSHQISVNLNGYYNQSLAEMTMYPENPEEHLMFMYTWPDVRTLYQGLYLEDRISLRPDNQLKFSVAIGFHRNSIAREEGLNSLQIFYPEMTDRQNRFVKSASAQYSNRIRRFSYGIGAGYGDRAPSVSEGYGFYLFNSAENYDYIGNPDLKNETSAELNAFLQYKTDEFSARINGTFFHISNFITGKINPDLSPMTIGAHGVKIYSALPHARILNVSYESEWKLWPALQWNVGLVYARGKDVAQKNLPYISPFAYSSKLRYTLKKMTAEVSASGNSKHRNYSAEQGELPNSGYFLLNAAAGYTFGSGNGKWQLKTGVENLLDRHYTTYADWNHIPRPGRNFFIHLQFDY